MDTTTYSEHADFEWAVQLNRFICDFVGLWPHIAPTAQQKLLSNIRVSVIVAITIFFCVIPPLHSLVRVWGDMILMIENLQITLLFITTEIKILILWWKKRAVLSLLKMVAKDWMYVRTETERSIMIKWARTARTITTYAHIGTLSTVFALCAPAVFGSSIRSTWNITDPGRPFVLQSYYMYDVHKSPNFEVTLAFQIIGCITGAWSYTAIDTFLGLLIFHLCGQLEILRRKIAKMERFSCTNFEHALKLNVKDHIRLIRSVNVLEDTFALMLLMLLGVFSLTFCVYGFLLIDELENVDSSTVRRVYLLFCIVTIIAHMCLYCAVGELLLTRNEDLYHAAYEYKWYSKAPKLSRDMILLLLRLKKPLYITAGKMFPMTMSTFCDLLKTSAGYISVLLAKKDI